jgi:hypothetical protein
MIPRRQRVRRHDRRALNIGESAFNPTATRNDQQSTLVNATRLEGGAA